MKIELSLYALKLKNVAGFGRGKADPFAVVTLLSQGRHAPAPRVLGQTEVVENTLSPNWVTVFIVDYKLGTPQCLVNVSVFHHNNEEEASTSCCKNMGSATFDIGQTLGAKGSTKAKRIMDAGQKGTLYCCCRKSTGSGNFRFKFRGENLTNREGWFRKSDPFYELCRRVEVRGNFVWDAVFRSHSVKDNLHPEWEESIVPLSQLCGGDLNLPIRIKVFDFEKSGSHIMIGMSETTVKTLLEVYNDNNPNYQTRCMKLMENNNEAGDLFIEMAEVAIPQSKDRGSLSSSVSPHVKVMTEEEENNSLMEKPDFVEYINGGCNMRVIVGIDYTASNGDPREESSLHHFDQSGNGGGGANQHNDYETALDAIVGILSKYDDDCKFPVFGFGAKFKGEVQNSFQVGNSAEVHGVQGVLQAYKSVFKKGLVMSSRATDFTEVLRKSAAHAQQKQDEAAVIMDNGGSSSRQSYTILLIVTDGTNVDTQTTVEVLKEIQDAPMSVVIVGVGGSADFTDMQYLDNVMNECGGRDMVNFVQFEKYRDNSLALTNATLDEIPKQLVGYFQSKGIDPLPPVEINAEDVEEEIESGDIDVRFSFAEDEDEVRISTSSRGTNNEFDVYVP